VFCKGFFALPCLAEHENIFASCTLENVVANHAFVLLSLGCEQDGCIEGFAVLALLGLEKTIQS